jgi:hypothetical protein
LLAELSVDNYDPDLKKILENRDNKFREQAMHFKNDDGSYKLDKRGKRICISKSIKPKFLCPICKKDLTSSEMDDLKRHHRKNHSEHPLVKPLLENWDNSLRY